MQNFSKIVTIALAFVGLSVGAGFASGQEVLQFFVRFGQMGIVSGVVVALAMGWVGCILLQLGSFHQPSGHNVVFNRAFPQRIARFLDAAVLTTIFSLAVVMYAGAGTNLNQLWGLDTWVGSTILLGMVLLSMLVPADRISAVIAWTTPLMVVLILIAFIYVLVTDHADFAALELAASQVNSTLPNAFIATLSYIGFSMIVVVSMGLVIGGEFKDSKVAAWGGLLGGLLFGFLLVAVVVTIYLRVDIVGGDPFPMLSVVTSTSSVAGVLMAVSIYAMIFNSALGMTYGFCCRFESDRSSKRFKVIYLGVTAVAFVLSFWGFTNIVGHVFPLLGYVGAVLLILLSIEFVRSRRYVMRRDGIR